MDPVFILAEGEWWCLRCGSCRSVDAVGYCLDRSYMVAGSQPDALDQVIAQIEAARETGAEAGIEDVYAALVKAQVVLGFLGRELGGACAAPNPRARSRGTG